MAVIACNACGGKMNDGLLVCPHCAARRALTERPKLSGDEIRALLATDATTRETGSRGLIQALILPHPATRGAARVAEIALTVIALPLVVGAAITLALSRRARLTVSAGGELPAALAMTVFGGAGLLGVPVSLIGASVAAVWLRALIRSRSGARRGVDLHRIDPPHLDGPAVPPALPERVAPPAAPEPLATPADEPRLLR